MTNGRAVAVVLLWAALLLPGMLARGFWDPDEGRYGEVAREVWQGDGAVRPTLAGEPYREKPPLYFWLAAGSQMVFGVNAPATRLPSVLATLGSALLLLALVRRTHGDPEGFYAALLFLSAQLVFHMGQWIGLDAVSTFCVVLALYAQERALSAPARAVRWRALLALALAGAILVKGAPVFIAIVALAGRAVLRSGWRGLFPRHLLWTVPLTLAFVSLWAIPAGLQEGWDYLWGLTGGQAGRRLVDSDSHERPIWYYFVRFPLHFLPAAVLLPAAVRLAIEDWRAGGPRRVRTGAYILWFVVPFLVFTLISGKRERYLLPIFPAAAALAGIAAARYAPGPPGLAFVRRPLVAALVLMGVLGAVAGAAPLLFPLFADRLELEPGLVAGMREEMAGGAVLAALAGLSAVVAAVTGIRRRRAGPPIRELAATVGFLVIALSAAPVRALDVVKDVAPFAKHVEVEAPAGHRFGVVKMNPGSICLALGSQEVATFNDRADKEAIARAVAALRESPDLVLFAEEHILQQIRRAMPDMEFEIRARQVGGDKVRAFWPR